jgi:Fe-Mn family superoxide dismutase
MAITGRALKVAQRAMSTVSADTAAIVDGVGASVKLPSLDYDYAALEPVISGKIMELHHSKHHQAYVDNLNVALGKYKEASDKQDFETMISLQGALRFNGGGHINHSIFWKNLAPKSEGGGAPPTGELASYIERSFGDVDVSTLGRFPGLISQASQP